MKPPEPHQVQVIVFGPGYGECALIHLGDGKWIIIDSCLNDEKQPAAISYLRQLGLDPAAVVCLVMATHWHDDHIKGLAETVSVCKAASFAMSVALTRREFVAFLIAHEKQPFLGVGRGGTEIIKCIKEVKRRNSAVKQCVQERVVASWMAEDFSHGCRVELVALSPSDAQLEDALVDISGFSEIVERKGAAAVAKKRIESSNKNDLSIASLLFVGEVAFLFGADVEELGKELYGWTNIVNIRHGRVPRPWFFKVAHHGSEGAHLDRVWTELLLEAPVSVVTPWKIGKNSLPKHTDIERLKRLSGSAFITSRSPIPVKKRYDRNVVKDISHSGVEVEPTIHQCGSVALTFDPRNMTTLKVDLNNGASAL